MPYPPKPVPLKQNRPAPDTAEFTEESKGSNTKAFSHFLTPHCNCPKNSYPHGIKGETEARRWQFPVLGPTEYRAAQAQKEKATPALSILEGGFVLDSSLLHCPRYSAHNTNGTALQKCQHLKKKRHKPASPPLTKTLKILSNPSAQPLLMLPAYNVLKDVSSTNTSSVFSTR